MKEIKVFFMRCIPLCNVTNRE